MAIATHSKVKGAVLRRPIPMSFRRQIIVVIVLISLISLVVAAPWISTDAKQRPTIGSLTNQPAYPVKQLSQSYGKLPLSFEVNQGQAKNGVKFLARGAGSEIYLTSNEIILNLKRPIESEEENRGIASERIDQGTGKTLFRQESRRKNNPHPQDILKMTLAGANRRATIAGVDELPGKVSYFIGKNAKNWQTNIQTYRKVAYRDVYRGIDQIFYGNEQQLEYDFIVSPGANPRAIKLVLS